MGRIVVVPEALDQVSDHMQRLAGEVQAVLAGPVAAYQALRWEAQAKAQVEAQVALARDQARALAEGLGALAQYLARKAEAFQAADAGTGAAPAAALATTQGPGAAPDVRRPADLGSSPAAADPPAPTQVGTGPWAQYGAGWDYSPAARARYEAGLNALMGRYFTQEEFLQAIIPLARWWERNGVRDPETGKVFHIPWQVTVVQAVLESDYGRRRPAGLPAPAGRDRFTWQPAQDADGAVESWNLFGVTVPEGTPAPAVVSGTQEEVGGRLVPTARPFRAYPSMAHSVEHYLQTIAGYKDMDQWLASARDRDGLERLLRNIGKIYATDSRYGEKCAQLLAELFG